MGNVWAQERSWPAGLTWPWKEFLHGLVQCLNVAFQHACQYDVFFLWWVKKKIVLGKNPSQWQSHLCTRSESLWASAFLIFTIVIEQLWGHKLGLSKMLTSLTHAVQNHRSFFAVSVAGKTISIIHPHLPNFISITNDTCFFVSRHPRVWEEQNCFCCPFLLPACWEGRHWVAVTW